MGRPLKKNLFGMPNKDGKQLVMSYVWLPDSTSAETGYFILKQTGPDRYLVSNGLKQGIVRLVDAMPDAPGEGVIEIDVPGQEYREYAAKIYGSTVKTFDGNTYAWSTTAAYGENVINLPFEAFLTEEEENDVLSVINDSANGAELLTILLENLDTYFVSETKTAFEALVTNGGGRQLAVALGLKQWQQIYGDFNSIVQIYDALDFHVKVETKKYAFIDALDSAKNSKALLSVLQDNLKIVVDDRMNLIHKLQAEKTEATLELAESLRDDDYTVVLSKLLNAVTGEDATAIGSKMFSYRQSLTSKKFFGFAKIIEGAKVALGIE